MKTMRRMAALLLAAVLFTGLFLTAAPEVHATITTATYETKVKAFTSDSRWKNGTAWGDSQKPKLSKWSSTGCCAYAADFAAYVYGSTSAAWTGTGFKEFTNINEIRTGDIIHISNHWFVVLERNGNTFRTAEGNFDDKARVCSDGWGIKSGKLYNLKANSANTFEYGYHYQFSDSSAPANSSTQIYYNIDMSAAVLASRTNQQVSSDCAVVSMATVEAYLYGATTAAEKKTVYNALVSKNGDNDYAYWSKCGYVSNGDINWTTVYNQLATGYPVLVHRPAASGKSEHWAVVAGYKGSTTTLEKDKFVIVDVYRGTGGTDIYTSGAWRGSTTIDRMVTRKNGIAITSLPGIRMAINHPAAVHQYGKGHGVYGYVTSNQNLTSIQFLVTNANTGVNEYNKTVTPKAKSYLIYNLDSEFTFAKWPKGKYIFKVKASTAAETRTYQYAFEITSGWPVNASVQRYVFAYDANGGTGAPANQTVNFGGTLSISATVPARTGYTFQGWHAMRNADRTWYCAGKGWYTDAQITAAGYEKRVYPTATDFVINNSWLNGCMETDGFTFYAVWKQNEVILPPFIDPDILPKPSPDAGSGTITGTVAGFGEADGQVTVKLMQGDTEIASAVTTNGSYELTGVAQGTYLLVVSKKNHVTRTYQIAATGENMTQEVKLHLIGDVDGNGKINVGDVSRIAAFIRKTRTLTEYEQLVANVNGGKLNVGDLSAVYAHIKNTKKLF